MIIICAVTDVLPALSLAYEQAESGLLSRPPRDVRNDHLVDWRLILHAYGFLGLMECTCAMAMTFWYLQRKGLYFSDLVLAYGGYQGSVSPAQYSEDIYVAQSIYFFTLVVSEPWWSAAQGYNSNSSQSVCRSCSGVTSSPRVPDDSVSSSTPRSLTKTVRATRCSFPQWYVRFYFASFSRKSCSFLAQYSPLVSRSRTFQMGTDTFRSSRGPSSREVPLSSTSFCPSR